MSPSTPLPDTLPDHASGLAFFCRLASLICALSFGAGLLRGGLLVAQNGYFEDGLSTLAFLELQQFTNRHLLIGVFALVGLGVAALVRAVGVRLVERWKPAPPVVSAATGFLLTSALAVVATLVVLEFESVVRELLRDAGLLETQLRKRMVVLAVGLAAVGSTLLLSGHRVRQRGRAVLVALLDRRGYIWLPAPVLVLVLAVNGLALGVGRASSGPRMNVVLITIDTVRADRLSSYGNERVTTPNLDALAARGVVFENAVAQAPWTLPSMATLHSSLYPSDHGADRNDARIGKRITTLAEHFRNERYATIGVVSHTFVDKPFGFGQGFELFDRTHIRGHEGQSSEALSDAAIDHLRRHHQRPLFLWVHYFDPHYDYRTHEAFPYGKAYEGDLPETLTIGRLIDEAGSLTPNDLTYIRDVYDGEISFTDAHIGRLLHALEELGIADRTLVAAIADHGEEFLDHGEFGHGKKVYQEVVRVPLILHDPSRDELRGVREVSPVELRAVGATLLDAAGIDSHLFAGPNLFAVAAGSQPAGDCFVEGSYAWGTDERRLALLRGSWKLIHNLDDGSFELYDLESDPQEQRDLIDSEQEVRDELVPVLEARLRTLPVRETEPARLDGAERERLRGLGYIE